MITKSKTNKTILKLIYTLAVFLYSQSYVYTQSVVDTFYIDSFQNEYDLKDHLYIVEDTFSQSSISEILSTDLAKFNAKDYKLKSESNYWVSFVIASKFKSELLIKEWYLYLGNPEFAEVYVIDEDYSIIDSLYSGRWRPLKEKSIGLGHNKQRVKLSLDLNASKRFLIHYSKGDQQSYQITPVLKLLDFYQTAENFYNTKRDWSFLGFLLTMIFFNMVFFLSTKDKTFLYHSLFILGVVLFLLDYYNISRNMFFVSEHPILIQFINLSAVILFSTMYFLFMRSYLNLSTLFPNWDKVFKYMPYIMFLFMFLLIIYYYMDFNERVVDRIAATGILVFYFINFIFIFPLFKVWDLKVYLIIAGTISFLIAIAFNLYSFIMDYGTWIEMIQIGMTGEIIFFSMGLGLRFKQLKEEEQEAIRIKELDEFKSKVFTNISHEFRTPLTIIQGLSELIKDSIQEGNYINIENNYKTIDKNCNELLDLVNQMMELSKIENKNLNVNNSIINIPELIQNTLQSFQTEADKKEIHLDYHNKTKGLSFELDRDKLFTIVKNLLSNAIKFTPRTGKITVETSLESEDNQSHLLIKVIDTGKGIPESDIPRIFDRFYQVSDGSKNVGTGIGLALVKELVELIGGEIKLESDLHKGSCFSFTLPQLNEKQIALNQEDRVETQLESEIDILEDEIEIDNKPLLLIVEDSEDIRDYLAKLLKDSYKLYFAENGSIGFDLALKHVPDLIITDVMMPIMNGIQLCDKIKSNEKLDHIPILMLTAKSSMDSKLEGLKTGADAYITKPFKKEELIIRLEKLNELRNKLQKKYSQFKLLEKTPERKKENSFLLKLHSVIEEHLEEPDFNVESLSTHMFMSRMQLHRKLKALSGKSASNYVRSYKLYKAKPLLEDLSLSISEIAWRVGFQDSNYFSKSFNKEFGMTPTEFRERLD